MVNLDVMLAKRKRRLGDLADAIGISIQNLSILKTGKAKAMRARGGRIVVVDDFPEPLTPPDGRVDVIALPYDSGVAVGRNRGLAAVDEVDPSDRLGRVVAVSGRRALGRGQKALFLVEAKGLRGSARPLGEFSDPHCCLPPWPRLTFPCTGRSSMAETEQKAKD